MPRFRLAPMVGAVLAAAAIAPAAASAAQVWPALTTDHVFPDSTPAANADAGLNLLTARGEQEGGQVAVRPDGPVRVPATVGDLTGPGVIPAANVSVYRVGYVRLTQPSTGIGPLHGDGRYGDPLIPVDGGVDLPGGETTALYVLVDVPAGQTPGTYAGALDLGALGRFPLSVDVTPATANRDEFPIVARLHTINLAKSLGTTPDDPAFVKGVYGDLLPMLRARGVSPGRAPLADPVVDAASGTATFGPRSSANLDAYFGMGFARTAVPFLPNQPTYSGGEDRAYTATAQRQATANGIAARFGGRAGSSYSLVVDEPTEAEYPVVNRAASILHAASPRIPVMVTEAPSAKAVAQMGSAVDIWTPPLWDLYKDPAASRRVVSQGKTLWWYTYGSDTQRYTPNVLIDKSGADPRVLGWLAQKEGVQGFFYWGLNNWGGKDNFVSPNADAWYLSHTKADVKCGAAKRAVGGNGEASLIWPGSSPSRPAYGSLRLESLRDGAEDNSLLRQLQTADPAAYAQVMNGISKPFTGTTDGDEGDACGDYARPGYLPVVDDSPADLDAARRIVLARLSGRPLATLSGRIVAPQAAETGRRRTRGKSVVTRGVHGAIVRFGTLETTTKPDGSWTLTNVPAVAGEVKVSLDSEGTIGAVSAPVDRATLQAGGGVVTTPSLPTRPSRPLVGPGLGRFTAAARPAAVRERAGTVTLTVGNKYTAAGRSAFGAGGKTPSVEAFYTRKAASRAARNWKAYRYLDLTVEVLRQSKEGQRWYLIVTPGGHFTNSRNLAVGRKVQHVRIDLRRPHASKGVMKGMNNVKYIRFGLQSALPQDWRAGQSPTVKLRVSNMRLVK